MSTKNKVLGYLSVFSILLLTIALFSENAYNSLALYSNNYSYTCNDIVFGEDVVGTGSSKDISGTYYTITNWTNSKHTENYAAVIGGTVDTKREGNFTLNLNNLNCVRAIVYATGYAGDAKSNIYLAINESEQKVEYTPSDGTYEFKPYYYEKINSSTLTFRNILGNKKGRICISKIVLRLTN